MWSILGLALLAGMHHALEADHVAAVSSLVANRKRTRDIILHGISWGAGHTLTLFGVSALVLALGQTIPANLANGLEGLVGMMLVGLGGHVLYRLWRDRVHFHAHTHGDGRKHFHGHSHAAESRKPGHVYELHSHQHRFQVRWRSLLVGMTHGMAGTAALLVFAVSQFSSTALSLGYVLVFGAGSILGMAAMSAIISVPLVLSAKILTLANRTLQGAVAIITIGIGLFSIYAVV